MNAGGAIHETAVRGFTAGVDAYERGRPSYPEALLDLFRAEVPLTPEATVLDVGAGTGKLTAMLVAAGARVVGIEPVAAMRDRLATALPTAGVVAGRAEALPVAAATADLVTVAQAFHWMDPQPALAEFARALRPGAPLAIAWNTRDAAAPWVRELNRVIRWNAGDIPTFDAGDERWVSAIERSGRFVEVEERVFRNDQELDRETLAARVASTSYIAAMDPGERDRLLDQVRDLVAPFGDTFTLPHLTMLFWCRTPS